MLVSVGAGDLLHLEDADVDDAVDDAGEAQAALVGGRAGRNEGVGRRR